MSVNTCGKIEILFGEVMQQEIKFKFWLLLYDDHRYLKVLQNGSGPFISFPISQQRTGWVGLNCCTVFDLKKKTDLIEREGKGCGRPMKKGDTWPVIRWLFLCCIECMSPGEWITTRNTDEYSSWSTLIPITGVHTSFPSFIGALHKGYYRDVCLSHKREFHSPIMYTEPGKVSLCTLIDLWER